MYRGLPALMENVFDVIFSSPIRITYLAIEILETK